MATVFATVTTQGPPGPTGPAGYSPVYIVAAGPPNTGVGSDHDMYIDSTNGNVYGPKIGGVWGPIVCNIKGPTGATGATGPAGYSPQYIVAAGPPSGGQGNNGDMYINSTTSDVYGPKASGAWGGIVCNIKGIQGPPGVAYTPMGAWVSTTTYAQGHEVTYNSQLYISLQSTNLNNVPATSPTWWQLVGSGASQTPWLSDIDGATFTLKSAGKVGVGVVPTTLVHTKGANTPAILIEGTANTVALELKDSAATPNRWWLACGIGTATDGKFGIYDARQGVSRLTVDTVGSVGIGTTSPLVPLQVTGDVTRQVYLTGATSPTSQLRIGYDVSNNTGVVEALNSGGPRPLLLNPSGGAGNVGIGTTGPETMLTVYTGSLGTAAGAALWGVQSQANTNNTDRIRTSIRRNTAGSSWDTCEWRIEHIVDSTNFAWVGFPGADMTVATASIERMRFSNGGNVFVTMQSGNGFQVTGSAARGPSPPALGQVGNSLLQVMIAGAYGLLAGVLDSGSSYLQCQRIDGNASPYHLLLQPSGGNVGIGTATPGALLDVAGGDIRIGNGRNLIFNPASDSGIQFFGGTTINRRSSDGSLLITAAQGYCWITSISGTLITGGNVAIGATTAYTKLAVIPTANPSTPATAVQISVGESSNNPAYRLELGYYYSGSAYNAVIQATQNGPATGVLLLNPGGGTIGIGKTVPGYALDVTGSVNVTGQYLVNGVPLSTGGVTVLKMGTAVGTSATLDLRNGISTIANATNQTSSIWITFDMTSDRRIKQNVADLSGGLGVINSLRPVSFEYNGLCGFTAGRRSASIIAQELQEAMPDAVYTVRHKLRPEDEEEVDLMCFDPMQITTHLVLAVQQLLRRLETLEQKVN